jgi:hypothetical protein
MEMSESDASLSRRQEENLLKAATALTHAHGGNAERVGCPGALSLERLAKRDRSIPNEPELVDHVSNCAQCLEEYSRFRTKRKQVNGIALACGCAAILVLCVVGARWATGGRQVQVPVETRVSENRRPSATVTPEVPPPAAITIDLGRYAHTRGTETADSDSRISLPAGVSRVTLKCPVGWEAGVYGIRVRDAQGLNRADIQAEGRSASGRTVISFDVDLRGLKAGTATLRIRPPGLSWRSFRIVVER